MVAGMVPEDTVGPLFKVINERMQASADADLKEQGLTFAQSQVIVYLIEHAGRALQKEIEANLKVPTQRSPASSAGSRKTASCAPG